MRVLLFMLFVLPFCGFGQNKLSVSVQGVKTSEGNISVAVYNDETGFLKFDGAYKHNRTKAHQGVTELYIEDLPQGEYALAIFHDENGNDILDVNWLGIPKERVGFSNAKMGTFGPPSFKQCAFTLHRDDSIVVSF